MYYLRTKPATNAIKFTVDVEALANEVAGDNNTDIKMFNNQNGKENKDSQLVKRKPEKNLDVCQLIKRKKRGENVTQDEWEDCLMCGS